MSWLLQKRRRLRKRGQLSISTFWVETSAASPTAGVEPQCSWSGRIRFEAACPQLRGIGRDDRSLVPYGDREIRKKADSSLGACSNLSAFSWADCERRSGGARQREGSSKKHGNTYALRQRLFNDGLSDRPIRT